MRPAGTEAISSQDMTQALTADELGVLREMSRRVLWLSAAIVDVANAGRPNENRSQSQVATKPG